MGLKNFVKKHCPDFLYSFAKSCYWFYHRKMMAQEVITRAEKLRPYYRDELSLFILSEREKYLLTHDRNIFLDIAIKQGLKFHISFSNSYILIIYDCKSHKFDYTIKFFQASDYADKYKTLTIDEFMKSPSLNENELIIPVMKYKNLNKFLRFMYDKNLLYKTNIFSGGLGSGREDLQYFDVFDPVDDEIIIDAGCYDGATAKQFLEWGGGKVKKIYSFEFDPVNVAKCEENLKDLRDKVTLIKKGTWDKDEILHINASGGVTTSTCNEGNSTVYLTKIDSVVKDDRVTLIKMDVEGAELKSLIGAKNAIIKNHPRLIICFYHKPEDMYELPEYILSLVPEYRFYLRHYSSSPSETVLYASCD